MLQFTFWILLSHLLLFYIVQKETFFIVQYVEVCMYVCFSICCLTILFSPKIRFTQSSFTWIFNSGLASVQGIFFAAVSDCFGRLTFWCVPAHARNSFCLRQFRDKLGLGHLLTKVSKLKRQHTTILPVTSLRLN